MSAKIGFDPLTCGKIAGHVECADVRGPVEPNTFPAMMKPQLVSKPSPEVIGFANVNRVPKQIGTLAAEDVHARYKLVGHSNLIELEFVSSEARAGPMDRHVLRRGRLQERR